MNYSSRQIDAQLVENPFDGLLAWPAETELRKERCPHVFRGASSSKVICA